MKSKIKILFWTLLISLTVVLSSCCGCTDNEITDVYPSTEKIYKLHNTPDGTTKLLVKTYTIDGQTWEMIYSYNTLVQVIINGQVPNNQVPVTQDENSVLSQETYFDY